MITVLMKTFWKAFIFLAGMTVILLGIIMIVTPGPALIVIPLGLLILATQFLWARYLLKKFKDTFDTAKQRYKKKKAKK